MSKTQPSKTILYASDLGKHMRPVFRRAIAMAECSQAQIIMLHVVEPLTTSGMAIVESYLPKAQYEKFASEGLRSMLEQMRKRVARFCEDETGSCPADSDLVADVLVENGQPGIEIPRMAQKLGVDMIVMGSCSRSLLGQGLLGSTARRVTQSSKVPVLVVPNCQAGKKKKKNA